jgi:hypothetical protein
MRKSVYFMSCLKCLHVWEQEYGKRKPDLCPNCRKDYRSSGLLEEGD